MNAKLIWISWLAIACITLISYTSVQAYSYFTTTTIEDVRKKNEAFEKAKSELLKERVEYCNDTSTGKIDYDSCGEFLNKSLNAKATTGSVIPEPPKWYTAKHSLVLSGSHDYRIYSDRLWASWKNNNPSWLTWWVSNTLKWIWKEKWIEYQKWTLRPKNEWWNYILFSSIEHGLRAKVIAIRERWWKANVGHFLAGWWTDYVKLSFSTDKIINELSEEQFAELFIQQMKKESPWIVNQLVKDWILIIN